MELPGKWVMGTYLISTSDLFGSIKYKSICLTHIGCPGETHSTAHGDIQFSKYNVKHSFLLKIISLNITLYTYYVNR